MMIMVFASGGLGVGFCSRGVGCVCRHSGGKGEIPDLLDDDLLFFYFLLRVGVGQAFVFDFEFKS